MKYIIESNDVIGYTPKYAMLFGDGYMIQPLEDLEEFNSDYINEHFSDLQDTAYQRGLEDGKAVSDKGCVGCKWEGNGKDHSPCDYCCNGYSSQWTAKQTDDEIKVGDEVIYNNTIKCLVVRPETDERYAVLIDGNGHHHSADHRECKKTGRHFDISSILKEMQS